MLDFTKQITLGEKDYKTYGKIRGVLYFFSVLLAVYLAYLILFPNAYFTFDFSNPNSQKNSIQNVRDSKNSIIKHGQIEKNNTLIFDTALSGNYEKTNIRFIMDKKSEGVQGFSIKTRKSYQAFLLPEGNPMDLKDGTLLKSENFFYIVSNGKLRRFSDEKILKKMGFSLSAFISASKKDLEYNENGETIENSSDFPDNMIFKIDDEFYMLSGGKLNKFLSQNAYFSQYSENMAILQEKSLFESYPLSENQIGFSDGTLLSFGISAYIVSSERLLPINNVTTFITMGYDWNDIKQASADEISFYEKDKLFNISSTHPNGTILYAKDSDKSYLIENGLKRPILTDTILKSWQKNKPIVVSSKSLETFATCTFKKDILSSRIFSCDSTLFDINHYLSNNYEFYFDTDKKVQIDSINITFKKQISWSNFKNTARILINRIKINYGIGEAIQ